MVTICWAAKGGSGTTVVAATLALSSPAPTLLVDLDGDLPAALGLPEPDGQGVADWLVSDATPDQLARLVIVMDGHRCLLPWRSAHVGGAVAAADLPDERWDALGAWLSDWSRRHGSHVTVDAGSRTPPAPLANHATRSLLVTRPCYLALRDAVALPVRPTGVVLVDEPGRGLRGADVEHALGVPVEATVRIDPSVARAVDAGLLSSRPPRVIARELRRVAA